MKGIGFVTGTTSSMVCEMARVSSSTPFMSSAGVGMGLGIVVSFSLSPRFSANVFQLTFPKFLFSCAVQGLL